MNILWSPDTRSGANRGNTLGKSRRSTDFFDFDFRFLYLIVKIVLYSMIVISHWLTFVANYVILSKINVTNKVGQLRTVRPLVLNVSFICD